MVCCWFWPAQAPSSNKKKKAAKANTSAPRRRPISYSSSTDGTPLLAPRPAATSSLYARNDGTYHTTTATNNKRVREARPNSSYHNPPSPKKPKTKSSKYESSGKLRGRGTKRGPPKPHPDPHPCASCALHHPGHAHRTAHHQHPSSSSRSSQHQHHHYTRSAAPAPDSHHTLRRAAPLTGEPGSSTRTTARIASGRGFSYGTGPVYGSSSGGSTAHHVSPPGAYRRPLGSGGSGSSSRAHARPNTAARRSSRRADAPIIDVGTTGTGYTYRPAGAVSYSAHAHVAEPHAATGAAPASAFAVRAATNQALENVRRQAFRDQMARPGAPPPAGSSGGRRVRWDDGGRRAGGAGRRRGFPPYGELDRWL